MKADSTVSKPFILRRKRVLLAAALLVVVVIGLRACYEFMFVSPPDYVDMPGFGMPRTWDKDSVAYFLDIPIPGNATVTGIEGSKGTLGSYGLDPVLAFSFRAPPADAREFAMRFCDGILHPGYNPLIATDSWMPEADSVFIHGDGTVYYSASPGVPETTLGNRCARIDRRGRSFAMAWIEEIILDTHDPNEYVFSYRLARNQSPESYPTAQLIDLVGPDNGFQLRATSLRSDPAYDLALVSRTICFETDLLLRDLWSASQPIGEHMYQADVRVWLDGVEQMPANLGNGNLLIPTVDEDRWLSYRPWNYCITRDWEIGPHILEFSFFPVDQEPMHYSWTIGVTTRDLIP